MPGVLKLDEVVQKKIVDAISAGNYIETAAAYAGVSKQTLYDWLRRGARGKGAVFIEFHDAVNKALAAAEVRDVATIAKAAKTKWPAAAWRLERKNPDRWGRKDHLKTELTGKDGEAVKINLDGLSDEQLDAIIDKLTAKGVTESSPEGEAEA